MPDRPLVSVEQRLTETVVACTGCGGDLGFAGSREQLQRAAYLHAENFHDGDVDREGWA